MSFEIKPDSLAGAAQKVLTESMGHEIDKIHRDIENGYPANNHYGAATPEQFDKWAETHDRMAATSDTGMYAAYKKSADHFRRMAALARKIKK